MAILNHHKQVRSGVRASARISFLVFILSATLMAAAGCSLPARSAAPRPTSTVQQVLTRAQNARLTDETFDFTMELALDPIPPFSAVGSGHATAQPERIAVTMTMTIADEIEQTDQVFDVATGDTYMKITAPASQATNGWEKNPDAAFLAPSDWEAIPPYDKLSNVTLIGSEKLYGVAVWHIQGTFVDGNSYKISDIFVRQSDYLPAQQHLHATTGRFTIDVIYDYSAVNCGIDIDIPITTL